jgi:hypothetical protein
MTDGASQNQLVELAQLRLSQRTSIDPLTREEIAATVDQLLGAFPEWRALVSRDSVLAQLATLFSTFIGEESILRGRDDHVPWVDGRRDDIDWRFWSRYRTQLVRTHIPQPAINALDRVTNRTLELMGDPVAAAPFNRRGMVVGDVQAGKTSNYTGLICKAADTGYKVIIVLAGLHNNLRSQTQIRLDEGFIGKVSVPVGEAPNTIVGVGHIDPSPVVNWATNRTERGDFNRRVMNHFGVHPGGPPLIFVVKKIKSVLESVIAWVNATGNMQDHNGRRFAGVPLLMIDDEADNASIDTRAQVFNGGRPDPDHDPSTINALIRRILERFGQASYVGYTATPFANIFIHPDAETGQEFQDLFPRDFIINIPSPDNYVGPARVFGVAPDDDDDSVMEGLPALIKEITDHAESLAARETRGWMPPVHRSNHLPLYRGEGRVPPSLDRAISCFGLVVAARRSRGDERQHNSMLVHVTRYQAAQRHVLVQIQAALDALRNDVRYGGTTAIERIRALWDDEFAGVIEELDLPDSSPVSWEQIAGHLGVAVDSIRVREINGTSADVLDYDLHRQTGLNVIAVGGDKLARGLTLEGLSISYFLRGSRMYDTLMQMGRWFGYRPAYLDLCRLFTTSDLMGWYEHITLASEELRREFDRMETVRATPRDFGLRVRSHPTLTVTSRVKMRHGTELRVSFAGDVSETTVFATDAASLQHNFQSIDEFLGGLDSDHHVADPSQRRNGGRSHSWKGSHYWTDVPAERVVGLLERFRTHEDAARANAGVLARYVRRQNQLDELIRWNVLLVCGDGPDTVKLGGREVSAVLRQPKGGYGEGPPWRTVGDNERFVVRRLLNPRDEGVDIDADGYDEAMAETIASPPKRRKPNAAPPTRPAEAWLRRHRPAENGLLLIYPLAREADLEGPDGTVRHCFLDIATPIIGVGISFPASTRAASVTYVVNSVYGIEDDEDET